MKKVRLRFDELLTAGESYTVFISQLAQSYNDRMLSEDVLNTVIGPVVGEVRDVEVTSGDGTASIVWIDPDSEMLSKIKIRQRMKGFGEEFGGLVEIVPGGQSYNVDGLLNGVEYEIKLTAVDTLGNETAGVVVVGVPEAPEVPGQVGNVQVTTANGEVKLTWDDPSDSDLYKVGILWKEGDCTICNSGQGGYDRVVRGEEQYTISGLEEGTSYEISLISLMTSGRKSQPIVVTAELQSKDPAKDSGGSKGSGVQPPVDNFYSLELGTSAEKVTAFDGAINLDITAGTFTANTKLTISRNEQELLNLSNMKIMSDFYEIDTDSLWGQEAKLNMHFDQAELGTMDPRKLGIYRQNPDGSWEYTGGVYDSDTESVTASITTTGTYAVLAYDKSFADLAGHWSRGNVEILVSKHVINGVSETSFEPNRPITRAELAKILVVMLSDDSELGGDFSDRSDSSYNDVSSEDWYYNYVERASEMGFVQGYDGKFYPNEPVSRQEMAAMFVRALKLKIPEGIDSLTYSDASQASSWAASYIAAATQAQIMQGQGDNLFVPNAISTRAEAVTVALRVMIQLGLIVKDCGG